MVFESVLVQLLNRVLGDYVENLDRNQLNVGIWGGDVKLKNLVLKQTALDELDLPVQTVYGCIGTLVLKIPWKNLYGSAFVIDVEDIYLLAVPNQQVKYDPVKEEKKEIDAKKKEISKVEDAKRQELEKDKPKADFTFVEKLITQIIKNVQLNIKNIHIRYEDNVTNPLSAFALGVTLSDLNVVSTDETWKPAIITQESIAKIFKIVKLDGLALYWNCNSPSYVNLPAVDLIHKMMTEIASKNSTPSNYSYILGPINSSARLRINQKPELDTPAYTIPKIHLNLDMEKLFVGITKAQYRDIIALAESMERMSKGIPYRKYRPSVDTYKNHYEEWWKFAYTCVLEGEVRRRRQNWNWAHIAHHRSLCREYGELYQKKLRNLVKGGEEARRIEECEKKLDIFNIVIIRQRIELETERLDKVKGQAEKKSWFGWMWGGSPSQEQLDINDTTAILKQFEDAMTKEEKARLYKAIDYQENASPAQFPEGYVDNSCTFLLRTLEIELRDDDHIVKRILFTELKGVKCRLDTRAAASAIRVHVKIDEFATYGLQQDDFIPSMVTSKTGGGDTGLLEVTFETNPLDKTCGQRLHVTSQPLKIVYDAETIIKIVEVFKVPSSSTLDQLSAAAGNGLTNIKEKSATGLQHAIDTHVYLDLKINLQAPYIIIPYGGKYTENENVLVLNLGNVKMYSTERPHRQDVRRMHSEGFDDKEILKQMIVQSYDKFELELTDLQVLIAQSSEDWKGCIKESRMTDMHILNPLNLKINLFKCLITDDPRLPLTKVSGELPSINITISDARLLLLMALGTSIPLPKSDLPESTPLSHDLRKDSSMIMLKYLEMQEKAQKTKHLIPSGTDDEKDLMQFTTVEAKFVISEFSMKLMHQESVESPSTDVASFKASSLECDLTQQTYNTRICLRLASIGLTQYHNTSEISIINTPELEHSDEYLFVVKFMQVDKNSPEFHSVYKSCESSLILEFARLGIVLHKEGLLGFIQFAKNLQMEIEEATGSGREQMDRIASTHSTGLKRQLSTLSEGIGFGGQTDKKRNKVRNPVVETIKFKLSAQLQELNVKFETDACPISSCAVKGIYSDIIIKDPYTQINATLKQIAIVDFNPESIHNLILSVTGDEALNARVVLYNLEINETDKSDMSVDLTMGGLRIVFLNWFVARMLDFLNEFQTAQEKIIEASQAAAQSAKENMQNVYAKATKISLNINLKAPDIVVPADSKNYEALLLDMGHISISNQFFTLDVKNDQNFSAVIDEMKLSLTDFKLSRIKLNNKNETVEELRLLEPITFKLAIKRNLSTSWYRAIPDIDVLAKMNTVEVLLSQADYQMIMSVLNGNLSEGQTDKTPKAPAVKSIERRNSLVSNVETTMLMSEKSTVQVMDIKLTQSEIDPKVSTFVRFSFTMENLIIHLFSGGQKTLAPSKMSLSEERQGLARFSLEGISLKGRMLSDNSIVTSFLLVNCLLDDMRKGREDKLTRLIQRSQESPDLDVSTIQTSSESISSARSMIDVTFQMKESQLFADVRVYSFTLIVSVDYLLKIAEFFNVDNKSEQPLTTTNKSKELTKSSVTTVKSIRSEVKSKTSVTPEEKEQQITLNLKIEKPDIILVEHMDNIDTNALILNSEVLIKLRISGAHQVVNGSISDLQLYTCIYNPIKRSESKNHVLHPVTISLAGSTPEGKGLHVELLITNIRLSVSPATIELLSRVAATATGSDSKQDNEGEEVQDHSDIWEPKQYHDNEFWFLKADEAAEATENFTSQSVEGVPKTILHELCIVSMPSIVITIEAGIGSKTLPMLILESSFKGSVRNWSSQLMVEAGLTLQMGYYNSRLALWEPLIEPVEVVKNNKSVFVPWELKVEVSMNEQDELGSPSVDGEPVELLTPTPVMSIDVTSENNLELTVTKTCLEVLNNLGKAFASAMKSSEVRTIEAESPYKIVNELGTAVTVTLEKGSFMVYGNASTIDVILENGTEVPLQLKTALVQSDSLHLGKEFASSSLSVKNYTLDITVNDKDCDLQLPVVRADKRFFPLNYRGEGNDSWGLISDVKVDEGVTVITLRSVLQVYNHFNVPVEVYYMTVRGNELASLAVVEPGGVINIPLHAVYTPTNELFFSVEGYSVTTTPYIWKDLQNSLTIKKTLHCKPKSPDLRTEAFIIQAVGEMEQVYFENSSRHTMSSTCYNIHLRPAVIFKNLLPINIVCCIENVGIEFPVNAGETLLLPNVEPGKSRLVVRLPDYLEKEWSTAQELYVNSSDFSVWSFSSYDSAVKMSLNLGMHVVNQNGSVVMKLYCPFWMLNKTGLTLAYRKSKKVDKYESSSSPSKNSEEALNVLHHPANFKGPILFSFNAKNFFGKKKASVRIEHGEWSDKFSLDVAGSSGVVVCKYNDIIYQIGVHNQLTYNGLTKQITFTPYYVIINNASFPIECQENDRPADPWVSVEPQSCSAVWPKSELDDKLLKLRVKGTEEISSPFLYTESHTSLLKLKNKCGGINVDIQITEGAIYISLAAYEVGMAPALIINHTKNTMNFWEKESVQIRKLKPKHHMLYTWENPSGPRVFSWEGGNRKEYHDELRKDGCGEYSVAENYQIYWTSFLDGMQRVLLFTQNEAVAENAQAANLFEVIQQEITVSIHGIGLSLINNLNRQEIMYLGIASSGVIWEHCKMDAKRFKQFSGKESMSLETAYQQYLINLESFGQEGASKSIIDAKTEVSFGSGLMVRPNKRKIRRTYQTGLWMQMKSSPSQLQLHAKVNRLQIDNQMFDCIFPVVLAPVPIPKSVAANSGIKPFAELSIVQLLMKNSQIRQFKYFKVLIQEFHIKVDLGFVNALVEVLQSSDYTEHEEQQQFLTDMHLVDEPLYAHVSTQSQQEQKSFYDLLHFSPLKIHISFSMAAGTSAGQEASTPNFLNVLLQGLGVTLTDLQDVIFKLAYFERECTFLTQKQLISEATSHYVGQSVKQLYVLVLGLDVLGNPYGLVLGITKGVEDLFYEPFQGAIQGPGEFAEGLVLGVRSLFGHTVGGAAGAVSRITGAMGKGIAALTFDKDYQRKRRDQINKKPATVQEGIARSGKGLVMGVVDGVTGVFTKPISGAKEEGFGGFFKGLGKGAVGLVARPTAGVVDFASGSLDAVKRATEVGEDANRLRAPRFLQADGLVRPYNHHEADGHKLLTELEKGKYATTDIYVMHYAIIPKKEVLLLTNTRLAFITHNDIFGGWQVDWSYTWQDLKHPPAVVPKGVSIITSDSKKKKLGLFGSNDSGKIILIPDPEKREEICAKIESLRGNA